MLLKPLVEIGKLNTTNLTREYYVFNGGLRLRVLSIETSRLQRKPTPQILFIGVFSISQTAFIYTKPRKIEALFVFTPIIQQAFVLLVIPHILDLWMVYFL